MLGLLAWSSLSLQGCGDGNGFFKNLTLCGKALPASLDSQTRIGGSSTVVTLDSTGSWTFYNVANELRATQVGLTESAKYTFQIILPAWWQLAMLTILPPGMALMVPVITIMTEFGKVTVRL